MHQVIVTFHSEQEAAEYLEFVTNIGYEASYTPPEADAARPYVAYNQLGWALRSFTTEQAAHEFKRDCETDPTLWSKLVIRYEP